MSTCPHCGFRGTDDEVDEHRATGVHNDEPQEAATSAVSQFRQSPARSSGTA